MADNTSESRSQAGGTAAAHGGTAAAHGGTAAALGGLSRLFNKLPLVAGYTILFALVACIAFAPLAINGKSFFFVSDGIQQTFNAFLDTGLEVRGAIKQMLAGNGFVLPAYDLSMGFGMPRSYAKDPITYLSVICPAQYAEAVFDFTVVLRMWLAGIAFMFLARELEFSKTATLLAMIVYAFSGNALHCIQQVGFINHAIYFPLVALGALRLLRGKGPWVYLFSSAAFSFVHGMYMFYVAQVLTAVFACVYLVVTRAGVKRWLSMLAQFLACIAAALLVSAPSSLTTFVNITSLDRLSVDYVVPPLYSFSYYSDLLSGFLSMVDSKYDSFFGFGALAALACAYVLTKGGTRERVLKALFVLGIVFMCVPAAGSALNGFQYAANRWNFGLDLVVACIVGQAATCGLKMEPAHARLAGLLLGIYCLAVCLNPLSWDGPAFVQMLALAALFALACCKSGLLVASGRRSRTAAYRCACAVAVLAVGVNFALYLSPYGKDGVSQVRDEGVGLAMVAYETPARMVADLRSDDLFRYDKAYDLGYTARASLALNAPRVLDVYGMDCYTSTYDNGVNRFFTEQAIAGAARAPVASSLDARAYLEQVAGVGYYLVKDGEKMPRPYGMQEEAVASMTAYDGNAYSLHLVEGAAPSAMLFDGAIARSDYLAMSPLERQEALVQGVVLDDADCDGAATVEPVLTGRELAFEWEASGDIAVQNNKVLVGSKGASIKLAIADPAPGEQYLYVRGLDFTSTSPRGNYTDEEWAALLRADQMAVLRETLGWAPAATATVTVKAAASTGAFRQLSTTAGTSSGRSEWLWNMGYSDEGEQSVTLTFQTPGVYGFDEFGVYAQPMGTLDDARRRAASNPVANVSYDKRASAVSCDVDAPRAQYLLLSVPYRAEWTATVDGEPARVMRADTAFMCVEVPAGKSRVEFTYEPRDGVLWAAGAAALAACLAAMASARGLRRRARRRGAQG